MKNIRDGIVQARFRHGFMGPALMWLRLCHMTIYWKVAFKHGKCLGILVSPHQDSEIIIKILFNHIGSYMYFLLTTVDLCPNFGDCFSQFQDKLLESIF